MLGVCVAAIASAESYPAKLITFVTPFSPGAGPDVFVRAIATEVGHAAGVPAIVENKPGASSMLAAQSVMRAAPRRLHGKPSPAMSRSPATRTS